MASPSHPSPHREPQESYQDAAQRELSKFPATMSKADRSAYNSRTALASVQWEQLEDWQDINRVEEGFAYVRDLRFMEDASNPGFKRRSTWLYPDDGCYARADLMRLNLTDANYLGTQKIFIFGNLLVKTTNHPSGYVTWWYHVAPVVRVHDQAYIMDPAISPQHPLPVLDWVRQQTNNVNSVTVSLCAGPSVTPDEACLHPSAHPRTEVVSMQQEFLWSEWERQESLGREPESVLGDHPPWLP